MGSGGRPHGRLCHGCRLAGAAVALPGKAPAADREFTSSFESGDPAPNWLNTVDTAPDGTKRASGVDGGYSTGIPGNVDDHVIDLRASGENTAPARSRRTSSTASRAPSG